MVQGDGKGYSGPGEEHLERFGKFVADRASEFSKASGCFNEI